MGGREEVAGASCPPAGNSPELSRAHFANSCSGLCPLADFDASFLSSGKGEGCGFWGEGSVKLSGPFKGIPVIPHPCSRNVRTIKGVCK